MIKRSNLNISVVLEISSQMFFYSDFAKNSRFHWDFISNIKNLEEWDCLAKQFDESDFLNSQIKVNLNYQIPKIIHQIWLGPKKLPKKYKVWMDSWKDFNPLWEYKLWTDEDIEKIGLINNDIFCKAKNPGTRSDILRLEILNKFGGLYADTDFECLQKIPENLLDKSFVCSVVFNDKPELNNAIIMSKPNDLLIKKLISSLEIPINENEPIDIIKACGAGLLTREYFKLSSSQREACLVLPSNYFYPYPNFKLTNKKSEVLSYITDISIGIHHWEVSWTKGNLYQRVVRKILSVMN